MTKTPTEKIESIREKIRQLEKQQKTLAQKHKEDERKARTKRLIERGAIVESYIDGAASMANDEFRAVLEAWLAPSVQREKPRKELEPLSEG